MGRKMTIGGVAALAAIALLALLGTPAAAQDVSPTQDQYAPPEPPVPVGDPGDPGFGADPGGGVTTRVIAVSAAGDDGGIVGASAGAGDSGLPYTGFDLRLLLLIAATLIAAGLLLRAVSRSRHRWLLRRGAAGV
jgi:hypothetical protein